MNHFIELDIDKNGNKYLVVHTGSRKLGVMIAKYWQNVASSYPKKNFAKQCAQLIHEYKDAGREKEISGALEKLKLEFNDTKDELAALKGEDADKYLYDVAVSFKYAELNRKTIIDTIIEGMEWKPVKIWSSIHNYIGEDKILRKGAISAKEGELGLIPLNMKDGALIVRGKGNKDWNFTAPHGAGRIMSRAAAKKNIDLDHFKAEMDGIYSSTICANTLDEAPDAYKPAQAIINDIKDTVEIIEIIKPIYNFKAKE